MSRAKLPPAKNWRERNIEDWNTTTYRQYMYDRHKELFGIDYSGAVRRDCGMLTDVIKKYGNQALKLFIDECFRQHRPSAQFPGINFWYMYTYKRDTVLQRIQFAQRAEKLLGDDTPIEKTEHSENIDELKGWF